MTLLRLSELSRWLGMTVFELWLQVAALLASSVLVTVKVETKVAMTWWLVASPMLAASACQAYFILIVFIRQYLEEGGVKKSLSRALVSGIGVLVLASFQLLLASGLQGLTNSYGIIFIPVYLLVALLGVKACQLHN